MQQRSYGELVLVVGDLDIPSRAVSVHEKFKRILAPGKIAHVLCVGNCARDQLQFLRSIAPRVHIVQGNDGEESSAPETRVVDIGGLRIGLTHGHQVVPTGDVESLAAVARALDLDVLAYGSTHANAILEFEDRCFVNPGSLTGAPSTYAWDGALGGGPTGKPVFPAPVPSFTLMSITQGGGGSSAAPRVEFFVYELVDDELLIKKSSFVKGGSSAER